MVNAMPPKGDKDGYGFQEYPGLMPPMSIKETPGERATNSTEPMNTNKGVPMKGKPNAYG